MNSVNLTVCLLCAAVMFVLIVGSYADNVDRNRTVVIVIKMLKSIFLLDFFVALEYLFVEHIPWSRSIFAVLTGLSLFSLLFYFCAYTVTYVDLEEAKMRRDFRFLNIICLIGTVCFWVAAFPSVKEPVVRAAICICAISLPEYATGIVIRFRKNLKAENILAFSTYLFVSIVSLVLQLCFSDLMLMPAGLTLSVLFIYVVIVRRNSMLISEQRAELAEARIKMLQMQMNPHFLSNTMNTIYHLCEADTSKAMQGIDDLSGFLRNNLDLSAEEGLISFEKELKSIKYYYSLEQMRKGDKLKITYMIETTDFVVPPFSVQVFAENAVAHGYREDIGETISFMVRRLFRYIEISIIDDGKGFDSDSYDSDENPGHYGISNAGNRLKQLLNAEINITSSPGAGTIVIIRIPIGNGGKV